MSDSLKLSGMAEDKAACPRAWAKRWVLEERGLCAW